MASCKSDDLCVTERKPWLYTRFLKSNGFVEVHKTVSLCLIATSLAIVHLKGLYKGPLENIDQSLLAGLKYVGVINWGS